ncbi:MAG: lactate utilization protein [Candidatus Caldarchaeum sp.]
MTISTKTSRTTLIPFFTERFQKLGGIVETASTPEEAATKTAEIIASNHVRSVFKLKLFNDVDRQISTTLSSKRLSVLEECSGNPLEVLSSVDAGLSTAEAAIAETGTLVEVAYDDLDRLVSSLPRVHVVFVKSSTIVERVSDVAGILRSAAEKAKACTVSLISGPSRSGDIEQRLVLGVHGPHVVAAVVLKWL